MWKFVISPHFTHTEYGGADQCQWTSTCCLRLSCSPGWCSSTIGSVFESKKNTKTTDQSFCFGFPFFLMLHFLWLVFFLGGFVNDTETETVAFTLPCSYLTHATLPLSLATVSRHRGACALVNVVPLPRLVLFWRREQWGWITMCLQDWMDAQEKKIISKTPKDQFSSWSPMRNHFQWTSISVIAISLDCQAMLESAVGSMPR